MPDTEISAMTPLPAAAPTDESAVVSGGLNFKSTNAKVASSGFAGLTVNATTFDATTRLEAGGAADGVLSILDNAANERLSFTTLLGLSSLQIKNALGTQTTLIDSNGNASFALSIGTLTATIGSAAQVGVIGVYDKTPAELARIEAVDGTGGLITLRDGSVTDNITLNGSQGDGFFAGDVTAVANFNCGQATVASGQFHLFNGTFPTEVATLKTRVVGGITGGTLELNEAIGPSNTIQLDGADGSGTFSGDIEITGLSPTKSLIIASPDGTRWRVTIDNAGQLSTSTPP